jgi:hypothetical protein
MQPEARRWGARRSQPSPRWLQMAPSAASARPKRKTKGEIKMTKPENEAQIEAQISELISNNLAAEDADSGWVIAYTMVQALPVLKEIAVSLKAINEGIAPDVAGRSIGAELRLILNMLDQKMGEGKQ